MKNQLILQKRLRNKRIMIAAAIIAAAGIIGWMISTYFLPEGPKPLMEGIDRGANLDPHTQFGEIKIPVTMFYPAGASLTREERTIAASSQPVKMVEALLQDYFRGFKDEIKNTAVRGVYKDRNRVIYIDLSDEFRRGFSGDARYEYYLLKSLYQTVVANVSEARDVKILIEGREIETMGGHVMILNPLQQTVSF